jgi:hypothetical protein
MAVSRKMESGRGRGHGHQDGTSEAIMLHQDHGHHTKGYCVIVLGSRPGHQRLLRHDLGELALTL